MEIDVTSGVGEAVDAGVVAFAVFDPVESLPAQLDERLARLAASGDVRGESGATLVLHGDDRRVVAAGGGRRDELDADSVRDAAAGVARLRPGGTVAWLLDPSLRVSQAEQARAVVDGLVLGGYDQAAWKTGVPKAPPVDRLVLVGGDEAVRAAAVRAVTVAGWTNRARDLANRPANDLTPERFAEEAVALADRFDTITCEVLDVEAMLGLGMGALTAVGQGSHNPARLVVLRHEPAAAREDLVVGLVGKGVTFDTGGISLKPLDYMEDMKGDMAGGAAVLAGLGALAELETPLRILAVIGAAENVTGGNSFRPGDILTAMNGKTIEVTNTDAEGRLVLADALCYARREGATHLIDIGTLTGAMSSSMGDFYAGAFGNDEEWRDAVVGAGEASGDHAWPWPLHRRYRRYHASNFADVKNSSVRRQGIPIYAATFLQEFAGKGPWVHLDIAGAAVLRFPRGDYLSQQGGTGYGVRLLAELGRTLTE